MSAEFIEKIDVGSRLKDLETEQEYRVLQVLGEVATVCLIDEPNHSKLIICNKDVIDLLSKLNTGEMVILTEDSEYVMSPDHLSLIEQEKYKKRLDFAHELQRIYGPTWVGLTGKRRKDDFINLSKKYNFPKRTARFWINRYIQSGCNSNSLFTNYSKPQDSYERVGQKKNGRKAIEGNPKIGVPLSNYTIDSFDRGIEIYRKGVHGNNKHNRTMTLAAAYRLMLLERYTELAVRGEGDPVRMVPPSERPTYRQFSYYCSKHLPKETRDALKTSARDVRNNHRLLPGDTVRDAMGPMDIVEIDAWEADIKLISVTDPNLVVGRPTAYAMIDNYSKMIVAVSISFDRDSFVGLTNLFLNLVDPIEDQVKKLGLTFNYLPMPTGYLPNVVRTDNGSDFICDGFDLILNKINVMHETVPAAMGSLKGNIERLWGRVRSLIEQAYENHGAILKHTENTDEMTAVLNLYEYAAIIYTAAIAFNQMEMPNYPARPEMLTYRDSFGQPLPLRPDAIWTYGIEKYLCPRTVQNKNQYYLDLMLEDTASLSRDGITFKGLPYWPAEEDRDLLMTLYNTGTKRIKIPIHLDPRSMNHVWYIDERGASHTLSLNVMKNTAVGMQDRTLIEVEKYNEERKRRVAQAKVNRIDVEAAVQASAQAITDMAIEANSGLTPSTKNLKENHESEKISTRKKNTIADRLGKTLAIPETTTFNTPALPENEEPYEYGEIEDLDKVIEEMWSS